MGGEEGGDRPRGDADNAQIDMANRRFGRSANEGMKGARGEKQRLILEKVAME